MTSDDILRENYKAYNETESSVLLEERGITMEMNYGVANESSVHQTGAQVPVQTGKELRIGKGESLVIGGLAVYGGIKLVKGLVNSVRGFAAYSKAMQMQQMVPNPAMQVPPQQAQVPPQPQQAPQQTAPQGAPAGGQTQQ